MSETTYVIETRSSGDSEWRTHAEYTDLSEDLVAEFDRQLNLWGHQDDFRIVRIKRKALDPHQVRAEVRRW